MIKRLIALILVLTAVVLFASCSSKEDTKPMSTPKETEQLSHRLQAQIDRTQDDYLRVKSDQSIGELLTLHSITYGSFTGIGASELLVLFKVKNVPHAGGLDRTIAAIYDADTYKMKNQKTFAADTVCIQMLEDREHRNYILYMGAVTYQGYTTYDIELAQIEMDGWISKDISQEGFADQHAFAYSNDVLQVFELSYSDYTPVYSYQYPLYWDPAEAVFKKELP